MLESGLETIDAVEQRLVSAQAAQGLLWVAELEAVRQLDLSQVNIADGCRSMVDWLAYRLDLPHARARDVLLLARTHHSEIERLLAAGEIGLDRAVLMAKLVAAGATTEELHRSLGFDLSGLHLLLNRRHRLTSSEETAEFESRHLVMQRSLDSNGLRYWGEAFGVDAEAVEKAIWQRSDELPRLDGVDRSQQLADALASICTDSLTGGSEGRAVIVAEVFVDGNLASESAGEAGVTLASGTRVGPNTLAEILCGGRVGLIVVDQDGRPLGASNVAETLPGPVRAAVWHRFQGRCAIAGCRSRYRLQPHHLHFRSEGGDHHPDNLSLLCWFHHHIAIHQLGMEIDPDSPPLRLRFLPQRSPRAP